MDKQCHSSTVWTGESCPVTNLFALLFANEERVFTQSNVSGALQFITSVGRDVKLDDIVDHQRVISDLVTIAEWNLNRSAPQTESCFDTVDWVISPVKPIPDMTLLNCNSTTNRNMQTQTVTASLHLCINHTSRSACAITTTVRRKLRTLWYNIITLILSRLGSPYCHLIVIQTNQHLDMFPKLLT